MERPGARKSLVVGSGNQLFSLSDATYGLLRDLIVEHTGVWFDASKREILADKLSELVVGNGLTSFLDYYYLLRYDDAADAQWSALMNRLAVPETFFWRQADQIEAVARVIAPAHFAANARRPLRIWSAACCTGEEPVSIALALAEAGILDKYPVEIAATDGSPAMIERAKAGVYGERSFRQLPPALRDKYFVSEGTAQRPIEALRQSIRWDVVNLVQADQVKPFAAANVIFCRNVFIYFSDDAIRATVRAMAEQMPADAYLFLGASESVTRLDVGLALAEVGNAFVYVKPNRATSETR